MILGVPFPCAKDTKTRGTAHGMYMYREFGICNAKEAEEKKTRPITTECLPGSDYTCGSQALNVERAGRSRVSPGALPGSATAPGRAMTNSAGAKRNRAPLLPALLTPFSQWLFFGPSLATTLLVGCA